MTLLDTHAWIWWVADRAKLSRKAAHAIGEAKRLAICDVSLWEAAMLIAKGRLLVDRDPRDWLEQASAAPGLDVVPIRPIIAVRSTHLGHAFHGDPADRLIVATALVEGAPVVTKDERIREYEAVQSIW